MVPVAVVVFVDDRSSNVASSRRPTIQRVPAVDLRGSEATS